MSFVYKHKHSIIKMYPYVNIGKLQKIFILIIHHLNIIGSWTNEKLNCAKVERIHWKVGQKEAALLKKKKKISREESKYIKTGFSYMTIYSRRSPYLKNTNFLIYVKSHPVFYQWIDRANTGPEVCVWQ